MKRDGFVAPEGAEALLATAGGVCALTPVAKAVADADAEADASPVAAAAAGAAVCSGLVCALATGEPVALALRLCGLCSPADADAGAPPAATPGGRLVGLASDSPDAAAPDSSPSASALGPESSTAETCASRARRGPAERALGNCWKIRGRGTPAKVRVESSAGCSSVSVQHRYSTNRVYLFVKLWCISGLSKLWLASPEGLFKGFWRGSLARLKFLKNGAL